MCLSVLQRGYDIRFGVGQIEYDLQRHESADSLLAEADAAMYAQKQVLRRSLDVGLLLAMVMNHKKSRGEDYSSRLPMAVVLKPPSTYMNSPLISEATL